MRGARCFLFSTISAAVSFRSAAGDYYAGISWCKGQQSVCIGAGGCFLKKILSGLTRDERFKKTHTGITGYHHAAKKMRRTDRNAAATWLALFEKRILHIKEILRNPQLEQPAGNWYLPITSFVRTLAFYQHLLKGSLHKDMEDVLSFIYEVDVYIGVSQVAAQKGFS